MCALKPDHCSSTNFDGANVHQFLVEFSSGICRRIDHLEFHTKHQEHFMSLGLKQLRRWWFMWLIIFFLLCFWGEGRRLGTEMVIFYVYVWFGCLFLHQSLLVWMYDEISYWMQDQFLLFLISTTVYSMYSHNAYFGVTLSCWTQIYIYISFVWAQVCFFTAIVYFNSHRIHAWCIYLHLYGKCR